MENQEDPYKGRDSIQCCAHIVWRYYTSHNMKHNPEEQKRKAPSFKGNIDLFVDILHTLCEQRLSEYDTPCITGMIRADSTVTEGLLQVINQEKDIGQYLQGLKNLCRDQSNCHPSGYTPPEVYWRSHLVKVQEYIERFLST